MNDTTNTATIAIGDTIRGTRLSHGLAPAADEGGNETVTHINTYDMTVHTAEGNIYENGSYRRIVIADQPYTAECSTCGASHVFDTFEDAETYQHEHEDIGHTVWIEAS